MEELVLPLSFRGKELEFPVKIVAQGFGYRFAVLIDEVEVIYEKDDQGELRALLNQPDIHSDKRIDAALVEAIGQTLSALLG